MKKLLSAVALAAATLVAVPVASYANGVAVKRARAAVVVPVVDRAECLPWSERSTIGVRLPCIPIWYRWKSTGLGFIQVSDRQRQTRYRAVATKDRLPAGAAYVMGSTFCSAANIIVAALIINHQQNRELRASEAHEMAAGCFLPIIGPLLVRHAHAANPHWDAMLSKL